MPSGARAPIDGASLALFRIAFGALLMIEVGRYFYFRWIESAYLIPPFHFTYVGFEWVRPWPGQTLYWHFAALGVLALLLMTGLGTRLAALWMRARREQHAFRQARVA